MTTKEEIIWYVTQIEDERTLKRILAAVAREFLTDAKKTTKE